MSLFSSYNEVNVRLTYGKITYAYLPYVGLTLGQHSSTEHKANTITVTLQTAANEIYMTSSAYLRSELPGVTVLRWAASTRYNDAAMTEPMDYHYWLHACGMSDHCKYM